MILCHRGNIIGLKKILRQIMSSRRYQAVMSWKIMSFNLLSQLPIGKFIGRVLPSIKSKRKEQTSLQSKPLWKVEFTKSHRSLTLGAPHIFWSQPHHYYFWSTDTESDNLVGNCFSFGKSWSQWNYILIEQQNYPWERLRMGNFRCNIMRAFCFRLLSLLDFPSTKNHNCRIIP